MDSLYARRKVPGRSPRTLNFEVSPGDLPVADGRGAGFAFASFVLIALVFLILLMPSFFFRCF